MEFMIGCNYWASNAGTEMWLDFSEDAIREDMEILSKHGIKYLRVFPNWRDFQPVIPIYKAQAKLVEYRMAGGKYQTNPYYLDEIMLERFGRFCEICDEYGMQLIVGLVTGWMSGALFIPAALYDKNLYTDPVALYFQQKFVQGMVLNFKDKPNIFAWDLGNECNCLCPAKNEFEAASWTAVIANTIRANDHTRPVVSGMHGLTPEVNETKKWTIKGQAESCDIMTTHPYPLWVEYADKDKVASFRTAMHATCETKYTADIAGKPCFSEEIGTMGPMLCSDEVAADFMRVNLFSNWANGSKGVLWWCANEQVNLETIPYTSFMVELELGMIDRKRQPKAVLIETRRIADVLSGMPFQLPDAKEDAVCIITKGQEHWGVAYMTYCLAKQAGLNLCFAYVDEPLPDVKVYLVPSVCGNNIMPREYYLELKEKVRNGATLYISNDTGIWAEFEDLTGMHVLDSGKYWDSLTIDLEGEKIAFTRSCRYELASAGAKVLAKDSIENPAITLHAYGQGKVYFVNFPLEAMLLNKNDAFEGNFYKVYKNIFHEEIEAQLVKSENPYIGLTIHPDKKGGAYCVAINYSPESQDLGLSLKEDAVVTEVFYGDLGELKPFEAVIFFVELTNQNK